MTDKRSSHKLTFALHGVTLCLEADRALFLNYARQYLADLPTATEGAPDVSVRLHWDELPPDDWRNGSVRRWGRRILQADRQVLQTEILSLPGLQLAATWAGKQLLIEAWYRPASRRERLAHRLGREIPSLFIILIYYLVYFPLIHYLEQTQNVYLLHAGAVSHPTGGWALTGLPGSGKSTFTAGLLADPQVNLLSENLLLFDAEQVYAFPEPIHLSQDSRKLLPAAAQQRLTDAGRHFSHGRRDFSLSPQARQWQGRPPALFFLGLAKQNDCRPVPADLALARLQAFDQQAKEVTAYVQFAAALELIAPQPGRFQRYQTTLAALVAQLRCYELWLAAGSDLNEAARLAAQSFTASLDLDLE